MNKMGMVRLYDSRGGETPGLWRLLEVHCILEIWGGLHSVMASMFWRYRDWMSICVLGMLNGDD